MAEPKEAVVVTSPSKGRKILAISFDAEDPNLVNITMTKRSMIGSALGIVGAIVALVVSVTR